MDNTINGRTPEEIKKGLECCLENRTCNGCPYYVPLIGWECLINLRADSRTLILQLDRERDELLHKNQQLQRERDAAVEDMTELMKGSEHCMFCKYLSEDGECTRPILEGGAMCWQWRGVQKEVE